jgi:cobalt-zinc-cadmium efflux system outer membrane protein
LVAIIMSSRFFTRPLLIPGLIAVLAGCATVDQDKTFVDFRQMVGNRVTQDLAWRRGGPEDAAIAARIAELAAKPLSLDSAVQIALLNNRDIQAGYAELGIAQAELVQAGLLSNPVFEFMVSPTSNPSELAVLEFGLAFNLLDLFQRPARQRVAAAAYAGTQSAVAQELIATLNEVRYAYVEAVGARNVLAVKREVLAAAEASVRLAERFHQAGNISDLELAEEREAYEDASLEALAYELEAGQTTEALAALLGLAGSGLTVPENLPEPPKSDPPLDGLEPLAMERRLDMAVARRALDVALAELKLKSDWRLWEEFQLKFGFEREDDAQRKVGGGFELALPLFNQGQPEVARAAAEVLKAENEVQALDAAIRKDVRTAAMRVATLRKIIERYRAAALPLKQDIVRLKQEEYNFMLIGVFELLVARREQSEAFKAYIETVRDYWLARADLTNATGGGALSTGETP